jgi:hypothetical protein
MTIGQIGTPIGAEVDEAVVRRLFGPGPANGADGRGRGVKDPSEETHLVDEEEGKEIGISNVCALRL